SVVLSQSASKDLLCIEEYTHDAVRRMTPRRLLVALSAVLLFTVRCHREAPEANAQPQAPARSTPAGPSGPSVRVYVTNEASGDLTIIDAATQAVVDTAP